MAACARYKEETERLKSCILAWARELEMGDEGLKEKDLAEHGPVGKAIKFETWRCGFPFVAMRIMDGSHLWMRSR